MVDAGLRALLERHVELFNDAVRTGDYHPYLQTFAESAVVRFENVPVGPFHGLAEIAEGYRIQPPGDTMALIDMQIIGSDAVNATFEWDAGGTGEMFLRWDIDRLVELSITLTS